VCVCARARLSAADEVQQDLHGSLSDSVNEKNLSEEKSAFKNK
jgi:hypothetical protein